MMAAKRCLLALLVIVVLMFILGEPVRADTWGVATLASHHFDDRTHCEYNPGLGLEHDIASNSRLIGGFYKNSPCRTAVYVAATWTPLHFGPARVGGLVGVASGYDHLVTPAAALLVQIEGKRVGMNLMAVPRIEQDKPAVIGLQVKFKF